MIKYILIGVYGIALAAVGHHIWDWQYWLLLLLTVGYGLATGTASTLVQDE